MNNLHQLLTDARGELPAPSAALDLDRIAARGRRTIRRRRLSVVAAAVAVAASLLAVVRLPATHPTPAAAPPGFAVRVQGYAVDGYAVAASTTVTPGYEIAPILHAGDVVGSVEVYRPGAFDPHLVQAGTPLQVGSIPGFLHVATSTIDYDSGNQKIAEIKRPAVAWPYAPDAWAVVRAASDGLGTATLQQLASHLTLGAAAPVRLPFRIGYRPSGLSLQAAGPATREGRLGEATLAPAQVFTALTGPVALTGVTIVEERQPAGVHHGAAACDAAGCYRGLPGTDLYLGVTGKLPAAELRKVIDGLTVANPSDPAGWFPALS